MKSVAFVIALVGLMVLVAGGISQIQARSGTVMDFCPPQGTMNCAIVAKFWLKQANPDDRQIGGVADAIVGSTRDHAISVRACADTAEALRALAAAAHGAALRTRIGGLAELLCARRNGIATLSQSLLGDSIFGKARASGPGRWGSSGTSGPSLPAGFHYGYQALCNSYLDDGNTDCHLVCYTGSDGHQVTNCPPPPSGTVVTWGVTTGPGALSFHSYQWTCDMSGVGCAWRCLEDWGSLDTCRSPPDWGNGSGAYDGTWIPSDHLDFSYVCFSQQNCEWYCHSRTGGTVVCEPPPVGIVGVAEDHFYQWTCDESDCGWVCLDPDRPNSGACSAETQGGSSSGSSGQSSGSSGESSGSSGSSGESSGSCDDAQSSSGASGNSSGSSGQSSSGASGNSSGQGSCDDGASSGGAGTSGSSGSSGSSGESSGSSGESSGGGEEPPV